MGTEFQLIDSEWNKHLLDAMKADHSSLQIICPFIKRKVIIRLLETGIPKQIQVITRFNLDEFCEGVSDIAALRYLLKYGQIRGVKNLHAKLYLFGSKRVIVTSANLTDSALSKNHEFGFVAEDAKIIDYSRNYFNELWEKAGDNLTQEKLETWDEKISKHQANGSRPSRSSKLGDEGTEIGIHAPQIALPDRIEDSPQTFVKFFGTSKSKDRVEKSKPIFEILKEDGCHWACTYPKNKCLLNDVHDNAVMFIGRMAKKPNDIIIHGRAIAMRYKAGRDDATSADIKRRPWKENWPYYVRVYYPEFLRGILKNGISLYQLMSELKSNAFVSTKEHARIGTLNTNPRKAYLQQAAVELSQEGTAWMNRKLEEAFSKHGKISPEEFEELDWPESE